MDYVKNPIFPNAFFLQCLFTDLNSKGEASVVLPGLKENASYLVSVASKNEVGLGPEVTVSIQTGLSCSR